MNDAIFSKVAAIRLTGGRAFNLPFTGPGGVGDINKVDSAAEDDDALAGLSPASLSRALTASKVISLNPRMLHFRRFTQLNVSQCEDLRKLCMQLFMLGHQL